MIQTRSEHNGLEYHSTFKTAMVAAKKDVTIWKISFALETGERIRLVRDGFSDHWNYAPLFLNLEDE